MDSNANLKEQRMLSLKLVEAFVHGRYADLGVYQADVDRLCELVMALHNWIVAGGALPKVWTPPFLPREPAAGPGTTTAEKWKELE
jgi:hypothetical protein